VVNGEYILQGCNQLGTCFESCCQKKKNVPESAIPILEVHFEPKEVATPYVIPMEVISAIVSMPIEDDNNVFETIIYRRNVESICEIAEHASIMIKTHGFIDPVFMANLKKTLFDLVHQL
jgi:hypothetical protein